jgi:glycosyltransferase involved in cell wall biosynthesis
MPEFRERSRIGRCDLAILCYPLVANVVYGRVKKYFPNAKTIFDTVDLHYVRYRREYELSGDPHLKFLSDQFETIERKIANNVDEVWCITNEEKEALHRIVPNAKVSIIPNIHEIHGAGAAFRERTDLLFIGSFLHRPNLDSIEYFLKDIFPLILRSDANIRLNIVGSNMPPSLISLAHPSVIVHGFVEDPTKLFEHSRVFVSPLRFGAGLKGKIGQAMSYGLPVVTTSIGAEGFEMRNEVDGMIADQPGEFAAAVLRAYFDEELWTTLSSNGLEAVRSRYSTEVVFEKIRDSIEKLLAPAEIK